jgi:uncharacterized membrane protein YvbJ
MFCSKCGTEISEGSLFCNKCGNRIIENIAEKQSEQNTSSNIDDKSINTKTHVKSVESSHHGEISIKPIIVTFVSIAVIVVIIILCRNASIAQYNKEFATQLGFQKRLSQIQSTYSSAIDSIDSEYSWAFNSSSSN